MYKYVYLFWESIKQVYKLELLVILFLLIGQWVSLSLLVAIVVSVISQERLYFHEHKNNSRKYKLLLPVSFNAMFTLDLVYILLQGVLFAIFFLSYLQSWNIHSILYILKVIIQCIMLICFSLLGYKGVILFSFISLGVAILTKVFMWDVLLLRPVHFLIIGVVVCVGLLFCFSPKMQKKNILLLLE